MISYSHGIFHVVDTDSLSGRVLVCILCRRRNGQSEERGSVVAEH